MKIRLLRLLACLPGTISFNLPATTHYVNVNSTNPVVPYTSWATAATNIQDAINFGGFGSTILVTNGVYQYGGSVNSGSNRINIFNNMTVQSVNGPAVTVIAGYQVPGTTNGNNAVRCAFLSDGSTLSGFTLTNGATLADGYSAGGILCGSTNCLVTNCVITSNTASGMCGGVYYGTLVNCTLIGNSTESFYNGGGACYSILINCTVISNLAGGYGGGVYAGTLVNCTLTGNSAFRNDYSLGGGAYNATLTNCILAGNFAGGNGGAADLCTLNNCIITNNSAENGGGVASSTANNCLLAGNGSTNATAGGAAYFGTLNNCTLAGNFSSAQGAANACTLNNCIIYYNSNNGYADCCNCTLTNCCTTIGIGNANLPNNSISNAPAFVDMVHGNYRLQIGSPGIDAGLNLYAPPGPDLDGNPRIVNGTVDMGAYESQFTGTVHYVSLASTNPAAPFTNWSTAATNIQTAVAVGQAGEFVVVSNGFYKTGGTVVYGQETNRVALTNAITLLGLYGAQSTVIVGGTQTRCAYVGSNAVLEGFTLVDGRTRNGGDSIKEESGGGAWCEASGVVSNCVFGGTSFPYADNENPNDSNTGQQEAGGVYGGTVYNSTLANNNAPFGAGAAMANLYNCTVASNTGVVGGGIYMGTASNCTIIANIGSSGSGGGGYEGTYYNCVLANNSSAAGGGVYSGTSYNCTLASNTASSSGGGAYEGRLYGCTIISNSANSGGGSYQGTLYNCSIISNATSGSSGTGGGSFAGSLYNCLISGNSVGSGTGGGAYNGTLYNCTITSNKAGFTGGVYFGTLHNSIIYYNSSSPVSSNYAGGTFYYCDTLPLASGAGNITNAPAFANLSGGDFHLTSNSPCINAGNNSYVTTNIDLDGNPRIAGGTVDMGAYEFQSPASIISYAWLQEYGLPTDGSADYADTDGNGMNNWQKWIAGLNPLNPSSVLQIVSVTNTSAPSGVIVTWQSVSGINYFIQRSLALSAQTAFSTLQTNIAGQAGTTSYTDTTATNNGPFFYRVGVQ